MKLTYPPAPFLVGFSCKVSASAASFSALSLVLLTDVFILMLTKLQIQGP